MSRVDLWSKWLGEDIGGVVGSSDLGELDFAEFVQLMNVVSTTANVFGSPLHVWIGSCIDSALVVAEDGDRSRDRVFDVF